MIQHDLCQVLSIEQACFEYPWMEAEFVRVLRQQACIGMVAEADEDVAGYLIYELRKTSIEVLNIAVKPERQRQGIGREMLTHLTRRLSHPGRKWITFQVGESNLPAQLFLRANGFRAARILRKSYQDSSEDAYLMHRVLALSQSGATR
jgi:ribosomal-protein-alanine N-acetyltransferase